MDLDNKIRLDRDNLRVLNRHLTEKIYKLNSENFLLNNQLLFCNIIITWFMAYKKWFLTLILLKSPSEVVQNIIILDESLLKIPQKLLFYMKKNFLNYKNKFKDSSNELDFLNSFEIQLNTLYTEIQQSSINVNFGMQSIQQNILKNTKNIFYDEDFYNCLYKYNLDSVNKTNPKNGVGNQDHARSKTDKQMYDFSINNIFLHFANNIFTKVPFLIQSGIFTNDTNNKLKIDNLDSEHLFRSLDRFFESSLSSLVNVICVKEKYVLSDETINTVSLFVEKNLFRGEDIILSNLNKNVGNSVELSFYNNYCLDNMFKKMEIFLKNNNFSKATSTENVKNINYDVLNGLLKDKMPHIFRHKIFYIHTMLTKEDYYDTCYNNVYIDNILLRNCLKLLKIFYCELSIENKSVIQKINENNIKDIKNIYFGKNEIVESILFALNKILNI